MADSRAGCPSSLIEVTGILMEQGRKYGAADHNVKETVSRRRAHALAVSAPSLTVLGTICRLSDTGKAKNADSSDRICRHLQSKPKLHLRGKGCRILFIRDIEVR